MYQEYKHAHCDRLNYNGTYSKLCMEIVTVMTFDDDDDDDFLDVCCVALDPSKSVVE